MGKKMKKQVKAIMGSQVKLNEEFKDAMKKPNEFVKKNAKKANAHGGTFKGDGFAKSDTSKKQRKMVIQKSVCPHWKMRGNGKFKPAIYKSPNGGHFVRCYMCGEEFPFTYTDDSELKNKLGEVIAPINQLKYLTQAYRLGNEAQQYLSSISYSLRLLPAIASRIYKVSRKAQNKKKSDGGYYNQNNASAGTWAVPTSKKGYRQPW